MSLLDGVAFGCLLLVQADALLWCFSSGQGTACLEGGCLHKACVSNTGETSCFTQSCSWVLCSPLINQTQSSLPVTPAMSSSRCWAPKGKGLVGGCSWVTLLWHSACQLTTKQYGLGLGSVAELACSDRTFGAFNCSPPP